MGNAEVIGWEARAHLRGVVTSSYGYLAKEVRPELPEGSSRGSRASARCTGNGERQKRSVFRSMTERRSCPSTACRGAALIAGSPGSRQHLWMLLLLSRVCRWGGVNRVGE